MKTIALAFAASLACAPAAFAATDPAPAACANPSVSDFLGATALAPHDYKGDDAVKLIQGLSEAYGPPPQVAVEVEVITFQDPQDKGVYFFLFDATGCGQDWAGPVSTDDAQTIYTSVGLISPFGLPA